MPTYHVTFGMISGNSVREAIFHSNCKSIGSFIETFGSDMFVPCNYGDNIDVVVNMQNVEFMDVKKVEESQC